MITKIKKILYPLKLNAKCVRGYFNSKNFERGDEKICWLIGTPDHRNLGDQAIAYAEKKYISRVLPEYKIIDITENTFHDLIFRAKKAMRKNDIILLHGGGNFGNMYYLIPERIRRAVVRFCTKLPIVLMPQSVFFSKDADGEKAKKLTRKIYTKPSNIHFFAREEISHKTLTEIFHPEITYCVPDIVLSIRSDGLIPTAEQRSGIITCIRKDKERKLTADEFDRIIETAKKCDSLKEIDTISPVTVPIDDRESHLSKIWSEFASAKLVITDRLHGMIFAAITNTPCIIFSNANHKILGVHKWLKHFRSLVFLNSPEELTEEVINNTIASIETDPDRWNSVDEAFEPLKKLLLELTSEK